MHGEHIQHKEKDRRGCDKANKKSPPAFTLMSFYFLLLFLEWLSDPFISSLLSSLILAFFCLCSHLLCFVPNTTPFSSCSFTTSKFSNQTSSLLLIPSSFIFFALSAFLFYFFFPTSAVVCFSCFACFLLFLYFPCLPYFEGFQLHRKDKIYRSRKVRKLYRRYRGIRDNLSYHLGSKAYLLLYCSIVKFRAVFFLVNRWVTVLMN